MSQPVKAVRLSPWLLAMGGSSPDTRVFCFPHAGGGASTYRRWAAAAPEGFQICAVQLPGREDRLREAALTDLHTIVRLVLPEIGPCLDRPFALFGHSMGALIAFELARALRAAGAPLPGHLFISGRRAPQLPALRQPLHALPPGEFERALMAFDGTPREVAEDRELMALFEPVLRADFCVVETYRFEAAPPLPIPLTVFGGAEDREAPPADLEGWREHTTAFGGVHLLAGGHFFPRDCGAQLVAAMHERLGRESLA